MFDLSRKDAEMVTVNVDYEGDLRCRATHGPSRSELITDATVDNGGKGESFSPTDLVAVALGSCILTTMAFRARSLGLDLAGATVTVDKQMATAPTRQIGRLSAIVHIPGKIIDRHQKVLEATAFSCPVHKSLSHESRRRLRLDGDLTSSDASLIRLGIAALANLRTRSTWLTRSAAAGH
jgi:putative redox protein